MSLEICQVGNYFVELATIDRQVEFEN